MSRWHTTEFDLLPERAFQPRGWKGGMTLEGGKSSAPAPDPVMGEAAKEQIQLSKDKWADYKLVERPWMQGLANEALGIQRSTAERSNALNDYQLENMRFNDNRYRKVGIPFEDRLIEDVNRFDSPAYKEQQVGLATADVQQAFGNVEGQSLRSKSRIGLNPTSASFFSPGLDIAKASALASAANKTRAAADQVGLSTKMQMYGGLKGLAGLGNANASLAMGASGLGLQAAGGINGTGLGLNAANNASFGTTISGMSAGIQGLGSYAASQQNAAKINNDANPLGAILGAGATLGAAAIGKYSDRRLKQDIVFVGVDDGTGLSLYEFSYKGGDGRRFRGVMADEVKELYPDAVITDSRGYMSVIYSLLGLSMVEVEGEMQ